MNRYSLLITRYFLSFCVLLITSLMASEGMDPAEQFLLAYQNFQQAERLERSGDIHEATIKYHFAESILVDLSNTHPDWQKSVVEYRLQKIRDDLERIGQGASSASASANDTNDQRASTDEGNGTIISGDESLSSKRSSNSNIDSKTNDEGKVTDIPSISIIPPAVKRGPSDKDLTQLQKQLKKTELELEKARGEVADKTTELDGSKVLLVDMKAELENAQQQVADLKADLSKTRSGSLEREASLKKSLKDLEGKVSALSADQEVIIEANNQLQQQLKQATASLTAGVDNKHRLEKLQLEMDAEKNASAALHEKLMAAEQDRNEANTQNGELQKQLKEASSALVVAQQQAQDVNALRDQITKLNDSDATKSKMLEEAQNQAKLLEDAQKNLQADFEKKLAAAQAEQEIASAEKKKLEEKLKKAVDEIDILQRIGADAASLREQVTTTTQQLQDMSKQLADAQSARNELEKSHKQELAGLEQKFQLAESARQTLETKKTALEKQLSEMSDKMTALAQAATNEETVKASINSYQLELKQGAEKLAAAEKKIEALEKEGPEKERLLQEKEKELALAREESGKLQKELLSANQKLSGLQEEVHAKDDRYNELKKELDQKNDEILALQKNNSVEPNKEKVVAENELLKGIVLRELKVEAKRQQTKKLITEDLEKLKINSDTLSNELKILARPVKLTSEEKALFKDQISSLALPAAEKEDDDKLMISASVAKKGSAGTNSDIAQNMVLNRTNVLSDVSSVTNNVSNSSVSTNNVAGDASKAKEGSSQYQEILAKAKEAFERQNYAEARKGFQDALAISPNDYLTLSNLGVVEFQLGKMAEAETILKKAVEMDHKKSFALTTLGILHYRQERLDDAEKVLRQALAVNDRDFTAHNYLGIVLAASGKSKGGETEIMKALEINPQYADAHFNLAVIYATGKPPVKEMAKTHYAKARTLGAPPDEALEKLLN
ncbi:MAG: tetratricopeptide repeat protein [Chthoniobacterales bacterium]